MFSNEECYCIVFSVYVVILDVSFVEMVKVVEFFGSDGVIVIGIVIGE